MVGAAPGRPVRARLSRTASALPSGDETPPIRPARAPARRSTTRSLSRETRRRRCCARCLRG